MWPMRGMHAALGGAASLVCRRRRGRGGPQTTIVTNADGWAAPSTTHWTSADASVPRLAGFSL